MESHGGPVRWGASGVAAGTVPNQFGLSPMSGLPTGAGARVVAGTTVPDRSGPNSVASGPTGRGASGVAAAAVPDRFGPDSVASGPTGRGAPGDAGTTVPDRTGPSSMASGPVGRGATSTFTSSVPSRYASVPMAGEATGEGASGEASGECDRFGPGDTGVHEREIGSSVILDGECVRGSCYRTKTGAGVPWVCTLSFASTPAKSPKASWVAHWLALMGAVWQELREAFGQSTEPDCLLFAWDGQAFTPLSFAQCTKALRAFLRAYGMQDSQVAQYRMHSFKATMLSWMNQLLPGDRARAEQGHHKHKDSVGLYGTVLGRSSRSGRESSWDGGRPLHRGGQLPVQDAPVRLQTFNLEAPIHPRFPLPQLKPEMDMASVTTPSAPSASQVPEPSLGECEEFSFVQSASSLVLHVANADGRPVCGVIAKGFVQVSEPRREHKPCRHPACVKAVSL